MQSVQVEGRGGFLQLFVAIWAMGFRRVSDLSDYTVGELLELIQKATEVLRQKLTGQSSEPSSEAHSTEFVVEAEPSAVEPNLRNPLTL